MVSVEIFILFLSSGASREEDSAAEDGWGSGERSEDESGRRAGTEVRSPKNQPLAVNRKSRTTERGNGKAEGERQQLRLN